MKKPNKMFILGLDGATSVIIDKLISQGKLKNIGKLIKQGAYSELESTSPPLSPCAWTSFMTGVDPSSHGIYDFLRPRFKDYKMEFFNSSFIQSESFWDIAGKEGKKSVIIDVPMTYPPKKMNGVMIAGELGRPPGVKRYTFPDDVQGEIGKHAGGYLFEDISGRDISGKEDHYLKQSKSIIKNRFQIARHLMTNHEWDIAVLVITATDRIQHFFWKYMDESHPQYFEKGKEAFSRAIFDIYSAADKNLGELMPLIGQDVTTVVMSDHGFGPLYKSFRITEWLKQKGYIEFHRAYHAKLKFSAIKNKLRMKIKEFINPETIKRFMPPNSTGTKQHGLDLLPGIRWDKTTAYAAGSSGNIYINLKGRQSQGIVMPEEYESLRDTLIQALKEIKDPATGEWIFQDVQKREDIYSGSFLEKMPDIFLSWTPGYYYIHESEMHQVDIDHAKDNLFVTKHKWSGNHIKEGIFIISGDGIKRNFRFKGAAIIDIAPTVLHLTGLKVPKSMDGRVLTCIMEKDFLNANPVKFSGDETSESFLGRKEEKYSEEESQKIQQRLKDLGYIA